MEESQLDYAAQASMELIEFLATCPIDEQEALLQQHVQKLSEDTSITSIFDPDESKNSIIFQIIASNKLSVNVVNIIVCTVK